MPRYPQPRAEQRRALAEQARAMRRAMTAAEKCLWERLRHHRLGGLHFRRQQRLGPFIVDFYCHEARLVVEVDGEVHEQQRERDAERDRFLASGGLRILRFPNDQVLYNTEAVVAEIAAVARSSWGQQC